MQYRGQDQHFTPPELKRAFHEMASAMPATVVALSDSRCAQYFGTYPHREVERSEKLCLVPCRTGISNLLCCGRLIRFERQLRRPRCAAHAFHNAKYNVCGTNIRGNHSFRH